MNQTNKKITTEEAGNKLIEGFECMDDSKLAGLEAVSEIQDVKSSLKMREAKRLEAKYGSRSPQAIKARAKVNYYDTAKVGLAEQIQNAGAKTPRFERDSWRFQGRVVNTKNQGLGGLTVALFDEKGNWIRDLGQACTDEKGYFVINYKKEERKSEALAVTTDQPLIPTVSDKNQKVIHQEKEPVFLMIGRIDSRLIIIGDEKCETPPDNTDEGGGDNTDDGGKTDNNNNNNNNDDKTDNNNGDIDDDEEDVTGNIDIEKEWSVKGIVRDAETGKALSGMTISLYDKDLFFDDYLGTTTTDENGSFKLTYQKKDFKNLFELDPDLYLKVLNKEGELVYTSKKEIRCEASKEEFFNVSI